MSFNQSFLINASHFPGCLYFSVVTFTTLDYGDVTPLGVTHLVAATEACIGALTLVIFVVMVVTIITR